MTLFLLLLFSIAFCRLAELRKGDHLHVSVQFLHQDLRTGWLSLPSNQLPIFMSKSNISVPLSLSSMQYNAMKPIKLSFEFPDLNRQTTWLTVYDGRGVFAERIDLNIQVKDHTVLWIDEHVNYYPTVFHSGTKLPDSIEIVLYWHLDSAFNSAKGYSVMMWLVIVTTIVLSFGILISHISEERESIMSQQYRQPKPQKND